MPQKITKYKKGWKKNRGHWLIPAAAVSLTSKVEVLQKLTKHIEAKGKGGKHTHVTKTAL